VRFFTSRSFAGHILDGMTIRHEQADVMIEFSGLETL
jgi:hypothetical protein